jgi:undecaprenyl-diphosphatase
VSVAEPKRIAAVAVMSIAAALFGWLAVARRSGATLGFDLAARTGVHRSASPAMTAIARVVATVGSPIFLSVFFAIAIPAFHRVEWKRAAVTLAEVMAGAIVCNVGLKRLIHCPRPEPFVGKDPSSYSFPSGHALYSLCFYGVLASVLTAHTPERTARIAIWLAAAVLVAGIGLSRVYLGVHYPSDVIAGYLGAAFVLSAVFAFSPSWS